MERSDVAALRAHLPERHWDWLDSYLTDESGWPLVEHFAGPHRAVVAARSLSPTMARVVIGGESGHGFVTVTFGEDGKVAGFALYGEEFAGIGTLVLSSPRDRRRDLARFYQSLFGDDPRRLPRFAFWGGAHDPPPRWPDPDAPPQMHLDARVADLEHTGQVVVANGATLLQDFGDHRTYADTVGHPFCLYPGATRAESEHAPAVLWRVVVDCFSPRSLAVFYERLLGFSVRIEDSAEWVAISRADGRLPLLAFQHVPGYTAPRWPDPRYPAQVHFDLKFDDRPAAEALALTLGAIPLPPQGGSCPVYADPAGHPLCFCYPGE